MIRETTAKGRRSGRWRCPYSRALVPSRVTESTLNASMQSTFCRIVFLRLGGDSAKLRTAQEGVATPSDRLSALQSAQHQRRGELTPQSSPPATTNPRVARTTSWIGPRSAPRAATRCFRTRPTATSPLKPCIACAMTRWPAPAARTTSAGSTARNPVSTIGRKAATVRLDFIPRPAYNIINLSLLRKAGRLPLLGDGNRRVSSHIAACEAPQRVTPFPLIGAQAAPPNRRQLRLGLSRSPGRRTSDRTPPTSPGERLTGLALAARLKSHYQWPLFTASSGGACQIGHPAAIKAYRHTATMTQVMSAAKRWRDELTWCST